MEQTTTRDSPSRDYLTSPLKRHQEKEVLKTLNDRLSQYIEHVKTEIGKAISIEATVTNLRTDIIGSVEKVKESYDAKLAASRSQIDRTAKDKARYQYSAQTLASDNDELRRQLEEVQRKFDLLKDKLSTAERRSAEAENRHKTSVGEKTDVQKALRDATKELSELRKQLEKVRKDLESATLERVDLHNRSMSLKEELAFKETQYREELEMLRDTESQIEQEKTYITYDLHSQVDGCLNAAIVQRRKQWETECLVFKNEMKASYEKQLDALRTQSSKDTDTLSALRVQMYEATEKNTLSKRELQKLQEMASNLERQVKGKDDDITSLRKEHQEHLAGLRSDLMSLREDYEQKMTDYKELFDLKLRLDQEIEQYRKLLEGEEARLRIVPTPPGTKRTPRKRSTPPSKRQVIQTTAPKRRAEANVSSHASGYIQIVDVDPNGRFIEIRNMADKSEMIGAYKLTHKVTGGGPADVFAFHGRSRLKGGVTTTIWSKDSGQEHNPPMDILCKSIALWAMGKETTTTLSNNKGEVIATYIQRREGYDIKAPTQQEDGMETDSPGPSSLPQQEEEPENGEQESTADEQENKTTCVIS